MSATKRNLRSSLKTLQSSAKTGGSLVGRPAKNLKTRISGVKSTKVEIYKDENNCSSQPIKEEITKSLTNLKHQRSTESPPRCQTERSLIHARGIELSHSRSSIEPAVPKRKNASVQVTFSNTITEALLTSPTLAADNHWQPLAEKRQKIIETLLEEKYQMQKKIDELNEELTIKRQMLDEANSMVEVIKELANSCERDDTGIDVNELSCFDSEDIPENI